MSDIESYLEKHKRLVEDVRKPHPKQAELNAKRAANAVRNTYNLLKKNPGTKELINILFRLYLQGGADARKPPVEEGP